MYALWFLDRQEGSYRYIAFSDFSSDGRLMQGLNDDNEQAQAMLKKALESAFQRGTLLQVLPEGMEIDKALFFLNSPRGRAACDAFHKGSWVPDNSPRISASLEGERAEHISTV